ncbi:AAA family ATPase [Aeromicrobium sp. CF3.5]|uniref:AAA family ATPase n=1 Tax=Aeromicrobium sp. CF3.5 TaxID=3373078 RepID=UPI003EE6DD48
MLRSTDPLPARPHRIVIAGTSGTGKTTLAQHLAARLDLPHIEIDALFHGPDWQPRAEFLDDVVAFTQTDRWITEWQYAPARPVVAARADLLVWLDLPFRTTLRRVVARTVRRRLRREQLWNGNVEPPLWTFMTDRDHIVRWSIKTRHRLAADVPAVQQVHPLLPVVRLRTPSEVEHWIARL